MHKQGLGLLPELRGQNVILVILGSNVPFTRSRCKLSERPLSLPEQATSGPFSNLQELLGKSAMQNFEVPQLIQDLMKTMPI